MNRSYLVQLMALPMAIALGGLALGLITSNRCHLNVYTLALYAIVGSYTIWLTWRIGLLSFSHIVFLGVGAYTTAILSVSHGWSFWSTVPVGMAISAVVA